MSKTSAVAVVVILAAFVGVFVWQNFSDPSHEIACTMEAKLCPDGSAVGRTGPKCEFAQCPSGSDLLK